MRSRPEDAAPATDLPVDRFLDREISWLQFNERVLQLAADESVPLLERARFLAIFTSNLDEFFMVRVAGLKRRIATGIAVRSPSGLEPREVLDEISQVADTFWVTRREVDLVAAWSVDRLGRSLPHLLTIARDLQDRGIELRSLTEAIDTTTAGGRLIFHVFGAVEVRTGGLTVGTTDQPRALVVARDAELRLTVSAYQVNGEPLDHTGIGGLQLVGRGERLVVGGRRGDDPSIGLESCAGHDQADLFQSIGVFASPREHRLELVVGGGGLTAVRGCLRRTHVTTVASNRPDHTSDDLVTRPITRPGTPKT